MFSRAFKGEAGAIFKGMLALLAGASLARIISLLSIPVLARIYSPNDFGVLALYVAFVSVLAPVMTLRYVQAIPLPKTDAIAFNLFSVCFKLICFLSFLLTITLAIWAEELLGQFDMETLLPWWWLIVLGVAGTALYELFSLWATRKRDYKVIAKTQFTQSLFGSLVKIGLGLLALKPLGLIVGQFLSQSAGIVSFINAARQDFKCFLPKIHRGKERFVVKYYQDFVWYRLPSQFLMVLSVQAPVMLMAMLYSKESTGQLSMAIMTLSLPVGLIGNAVAKAYYAEVAALGKKKTNETRRITVLVQKKLFLIGVPSSLLIFFAAEPLFSLVLGRQWSVAGQYAAILSPFILLQFTSTPLVQVINVIGSQMIFLLINIARIIGLGALYALSVQFSLGEVAFVYCLSGYLFIFYLAISFFIFRIISKG